MLIVPELSYMKARANHTSFNCFYKLRAVPYSDKHIICLFSCENNIFYCCYTYK